MGKSSRAVFSFFHPPRAVARRRIAAALLLPLLLWGLAGCGKPAGRPVSSLTDADHAILSKYEEVRGALAADDLRVAKRAATDLAASLKTANADAANPIVFASATELSAATALDRARESFKPLSAEVIRKAAGVQGYYVLTCPMTPNGEWLQTNPKVDNPYMGKIMRDCGELKK